MAYAEFSDLIGRTIVGINGMIGSEEITFKTDTGLTFGMSHDQDCCETVLVDDIVGNLNDLLDSPILQAEEVISCEGNRPPNADDSWTWTFYKLATIKGYVTIKWLGTSNGYYSESVNFYKY